MKTFVFNVKDGDSTTKKTANGHTAHEAQMKLIYELSHDGVVYDSVELEGDNV